MLVFAFEVSCISLKGSLVGKKVTEVRLTHEGVALTLDDGKIVVFESAMLGNTGAFNRLLVKIDGQRVVDAIG